jgi:Undecaprenyl-phosphate galactose phosphotransferase WbaP
MAKKAELSLKMTGMDGARSIAMQSGGTTATVPPKFARAGDNLVDAVVAARNKTGDGASATAQAGSRFRQARLVSGLGLAGADIVAFSGSLLVVYLFRALVWNGSPFFWGLWPAFVVWMALRLAVGLYPPFAMSQPEELRRSARVTAIAATVHLSMLVATSEYEAYRLVGLGIWILVVPTSYFARSAAKSALLRSGLYGAPYVVIGTGGAAERAIREMRADPELGMVPVAAFGDARRLRTATVEGVPVLGPMETATEQTFPWPVRHALIALGRGEVEPEWIEDFANRLSQVYPRVQVMGDATMPGNMWTRPRPLGPYLALEVRQVRFSKPQRRAKRLFDLAVSLPLLVAAAPVISVAALLVRLASPGPAFFSQTREGMRGQPIRIYKIRTMVPDAERRLAEYLAVNPAARFEWERTLKLRHDPRIIPRIGNFLRRTSIDELPQLLNIVKGDMSLVGPRIMPTHEVDRYTPAGRELRRDVPPGLTGLWQVTSRNNSDLKVREVADAFYVRNWSVWLDGWILLRTVRVVLAGSGAY